MTERSIQRRPSIVATLRGLVPERPLRYLEAQRIVELQANRLRELLQIDGPEFPPEGITSLPRLRIRRDSRLPVSGLTHWHNGRWLIVINGGEPLGRQRFSLAHEFAHVVQHTAKGWLCHDDPRMSQNAKAERLADYFAGCLLMPKRWVKRFHGERRSVGEMAQAFGVTERAVEVRLGQLGITDSRPRCLQPSPSWDHFHTGYFRRSHPAQRKVAA